MSHRLIVLPDDTAQPILQAIRSARSALNIRMFLFSDPTLLAAVIAARQRGVKVRVMLNPARRNGVAENGPARAVLENAGVEVRSGHPRFELTHQKSMVIDDRTGFVESLNWDARGLTEARDYAIVTTHALETREMVSCFDADWDHQDFAPRAGSALIWCPDNGRRRLAEFIDAAKTTLIVQNERYQDMVIIERLVRAALRGVKVRILARPPHSLKPDKLIEGVGGLRILQDVGVRVHTMKHLRLHAKMMLADGQRAIVGSINLAPGSFDGRRELAIETTDASTVQRLAAIGHRDWKCSSKVDLGDDALLRDLKKRAGLDPEKLVLGQAADASAGR
jgi:cardiolipin synthase